MQLDLVIERDLAVQIVGSDAGKARRMRPHGAMTKGGTADELASVQALMRPFLADEIRRVHEDRTHRPRRFEAKATPTQAAALKAFCLRFAASLESNLDQHPGDDNRHRSQQRLDQARRVVAQVDAAFGVSQDDGRTIERCRRQAVARAGALLLDLDALMARPEADQDEVDAANGLREAARRFLCLGAGA